MPTTNRWAPAPGAAECLPRTSGSQARGNSSIGAQAKPREHRSAGLVRIRALAGLVRIRARAGHTRAPAGRRRARAGRRQAQGHTRAPGHTGRGGIRAVRVSVVVGWVVIVPDTGCTGNNRKDMRRGNTDTGYRQGRQSGQSECQFRMPILIPPASAVEFSRKQVATSNDPRHTNLVPRIAKLLRKDGFTHYQSIGQCQHAVHEF